MAREKSKGVSNNIGGCRGGNKKESRTLRIDGSWNRLNEQNANSGISGRARQGTSGRRGKGF